MLYADVRMACQQGLLPRSAAQGPGGPHTWEQSRLAVVSPGAWVLHARSTASGFSRHSWAAQSCLDGDVHAQCCHIQMRTFLVQHPDRGGA